MATQRTELILTTSGGEKVKATLESIGRSGEAAFKQVKSGAIEAGAGLKVLDAAVSQSKDQVSALGGTLGSVLGAAGGPLGAVAVGATAAAAGFAALYKRAAESAGTLKDQSAQAGLSAEKFQELSFAFRQAGVGNEQFTAALGKFTKTIGEARAGGGTLVKALKDTDAALLQQIRTAGDNDKAFTLLVTKIAGLRNEQDAAALSAAGFGKGATALLPVLRGGAEAFEKSAAAARKFGLVISNDLIAKGDDASDAMDLLAESIRTNLYSAVLTIGPELVGISESLAAIITNAREGNGVLGRFLNGFSEAGRIRNEIAALEAQAAQADQKSAPSYLQRKLLGITAIDPNTGAPIAGSPGDAMRQRADELRRFVYEQEQQAKAPRPSKVNTGENASALIQAKVKEAASEFGIDEGIFRALIGKESSWNPTAQAKGSSAYGLTQLTAGAAADVKRNRFDTNENIEGGALYLRQMLDAFGGNYPLALAAYHDGKGAIQSAQKAAVRAGLDPNVLGNLRLTPQGPDGTTGAQYAASILGAKHSDKLGLNKGFDQELADAKRFYDELQRLQDGALAAGLEGESKIIAARDEAYRHATELANKGKVRDEDRAAAFLAIWQKSQGELTKLWGDEAEKRAKAEADALEKANEAARREGDKQAEAARRVAEAQAEAFRQPFENFFQDVQSGFGDLFTNILQDGRITSQEFGDIWRQAGARLVGELASLAINQAIAAPLLSLLKGEVAGGGAFPAAAYGVTGGLIGPAAQSDGGGWLSSLGSLFGGGGSFGGIASTLGASGSAGTLASLVLGLGAAQQGGRLRLNGLSGGLLGLSAARTLGGALAGTSYGTAITGALGNGPVGTGLSGLFNLTPAYGVPGGAIGPPTQAASAAASLSSLVSIVGSLYSLYSSAAGVIEQNKGFKQATLGDRAATQNFAAISTSGLVLGTAAGAAVGAVAGAPAAPFTFGASILAGAAVGATVSAAVSQAIADSVGGATSKASRAGFQQEQLNREVQKALGGTRDEFFSPNGGGAGFNVSGGKDIKKDILGIVRQVGFLLTFGLSEATDVAGLIGASSTPDLDDIFDKILVKRLNPATGLEFDRRLTVFGQGTTRAQRQNALGERGRIEDFAAFFNQISGTGSGSGGDRDRRTAAVLFNTIAQRAKSPEDAERLVDRAIRGFLGGSIDSAVAITNKQFFKSGTTRLRGDSSRGEYADRLTQVLEAFEVQLPRGLDATRVAVATLAEFAKATGDRVLRVARNLSTEDRISGEASAEFDGFQFKTDGRSRRRQSRGARRGLRQAETDIAGSIDGLRRGLFASSFGASAGFRLSDEALAAQYDALEGLKPGQFKKRLPEILSSVIDATGAWANELSGLFDQLRSVGDASRTTRIQLGSTIAALSGQGGDPGLFAAEIGRLYQGLPLAKSGGARVGVLTSYANAEQGRLEAAIAQREASAERLGIRPLASVDATAQGFLKGLREQGLGQGALRRSRQNDLSSALAEFRAAEGVERANAAQRVLAAAQGLLEVGGGSKRFLGIARTAASEVAGVTADAARTAKELDAQNLADRQATAARLRAIQPALDAAYAQTSDEIRAGLAKAGFSAAQVDAAIADPTVQAQLVQRAQLEKLEGILDALIDIRDGSKNAGKNFVEATPGNVPATPGNYGRARVAG